jgi:hypothetical protein
VLVSHNRVSDAVAPLVLGQHVNGCCLLQVQAKLAMAYTHSMDGLNFDLEQPIK